jgi:hypothetical protein
LQNPLAQDLNTELQKRNLLLGLTPKAESRKKANRVLAFIPRFLIDYYRHIPCKIARTFFTYVAQWVQNCPFWQQDGSKRFSPLWLDRFPWLHSVQLPENAAQ